MEEYRGVAFEVMFDEDCESPREWDNMGTMICNHRRYNLGDESFNPEHYNGWEDMREQLEKDNAVVLPLYLYDHSGITMNTTGFSCPWDSGQVGFIVVSREKILKEYGGTRLTKKKIEKARKCLIGEVETYDQYLCGDVYGYLIEAYNNSCWGFFGEESAIEEAKKMIDYYLDKK